MKTQIEKIANQLTEKAPTIMTGVAVSTAICSVVLAVKATPKAMRILEEKRKNSPEEKLSKKDVIKETWTCYIPTGVMLTLSVASMIMANKVNLRRNAALAAALSISEQTLSTFTQKAVERIGEKKTEEIKSEVFKEAVERKPLKSYEIFDTGKGDTLFYDTMRDKLFYHDIQSVRKAFNDLNFDMRTDMYYNLNDVYYALGLKPCELGGAVGWNINYEGLIDYDLVAIKLEDETPCLALRFNNWSTDYQSGHGKGYLL